MVPSAASPPESEKELCVKSIIIVGAGLSGTTVAAWLARLAGPEESGVRVQLVERSGVFGPGLAYGAARPSHLLNVPAGRMGAWAEDEGHFLTWLRLRYPSAVGGAFVQRSLYGEYLAEMLSEAERTLGGGALQRITGSAVDAQIEESGVRVTLQGGRELLGDAMVLALGNFAPLDPPIPNREFYRDPRYTRDPWSAGALDGIDASDDILLIGTGLTMFDIALELRDRGHRGRMIALSRRGLIPQFHRASTAKPAHHAPPADIDEWPNTTRGMLRRVRDELRKAEKHGIDWREVVTSLRPVTGRLWGRLNSAERSRFLEKVRPFWDTHRHRAAPEIGAAIESLLESGRLELRAARICDLQSVAGGVDATLRARGVRETERLTVRRVINCTGPDSDCARRAPASDAPARDRAER
jgi:uncharacterized NAD(P)/FAD-binding protein YdhS